MIIRRVTDDTMKPALFAGDLVLVNTAKQAEVEDIIVVSRNGAQQFARVRKVTAKKYYVAFDYKKHQSAAKAMQIVSKNHVIGVAVYAIGASRIKLPKKHTIMAAVTVICLAVLLVPVVLRYGNKTIAQPAPVMQPAAIQPSPPPLLPNFTVGEVRKDIPYCNNQAMDVYYPRKATTANAPVIVYIHGGAWENNNKASEMDVIGMIDGLRDEGYAVASIDYRKLPEFSFPAPVQDTLCAIRFMRAEQKQLGLDTDKIALFGFSAGGHLAAMAGTLDSDNTFAQGMAYPEQSSRVKAVVTLAGLLDFEHALRDNNIYRLRYFLKGANWATAAPISYITADDPPFMLVHGMRDEYVSPEQDTYFAQKLTEAGIKHEVVHVENAQHGLGEVGGPMSISRDEVAAKIREFIRQNLND